MKQTFVQKLKKVVTDKRLYVGVFLVILLETLIQLAYPIDRALPFMSIGGSHVGGQTFEQAVETVRYDFASTPLTLEVPGKAPFKTTSSEAGIVPSYRDAAQAVTQYSWKARFVPFSAVYKMFKKQNVALTIDTINFDRFYLTFEKYCQSNPVDAALNIKDDQVTLSPAKSGQRCEAANVQDALLQTVLKKQGTQQAIPVLTLQPKIRDAVLQPLVGDASGIVSRGLTIRTSAETWEVPKGTIANWLTTKQVDGTWQLVLNTDEVATYLESLKGKLYIEPGVTSVSYLDGNEISRVTGRTGQGIDTAVTTERISTALFTGASATKTAWVQLTALSPTVIENRQYSATDKGMQALIEQWEREHTPRFGIMVRDLSGKNLNAAFNADRDFVTASTFKMFLAYAVMHKIEEGQLSFDTQTDMALSVRACIDEMILHSTNACATSLMNLAGWSYVHNFIKGQFPATSLDNGTSSDNEKHTTVRDETDFLIRLNAGSLMNQEHTNYLLGLMKRQVYRSGIPKGVPGITVANKVGFYNGYKHDVGIVYAPRGTYILGILSLGSNDAQFADLSKRVYELMSR